MICPYCSEIITESDERFMIPFEKPYLNIYVHRSHWRELRDDLFVWAKDNIILLLETQQNSKLSAKTRKK